MPAPLVPTPPSTLAGERRVQVPLDEAARLLGISRWMAYKTAASGELPTTRIGRKLYVPVVVLRRAEQGLPLADDPESGGAA